MCLSDVMPMHRFFKFLTPMAAGLALSGAALAQTPSASQLSASAESAAAWQGCVGKPDAERQMMIEVFFGMMGYVAKTDRLVSSHESNVANAAMDEIDLSLAEREIA